MKRIAALLLVLMMIIAVIPMAGAETLPNKATVVGGWLRLRDTPSLNGVILNAYYTGTVVSLLNGPVNNFYHVRTPDNSVGYMSADYLKLGGTSSVDGWVVNPNGNYVKLRQGPGTSYAVIRAFPVGTPLTMLSYGTVWSRVSIYGYTGYMMSRFIDTEEDIPTPVCYAQIWSANGYGVNLRSGPSKSYGVIGTYAVGTTVSVLQKGAIWDRICVGSRVGWMMNEFLNYNGEKQVTSVTLNNYSPSVGDKLYALSIKPKAATVNYRWYVDGELAGTKTKYYVTEADEGKEIYLMVEGIGRYSGYAVTALTDPVTNEFSITDVELNNNEPCVGDTLSAIVTPSGADVDYEWYVGGSLVSTAEYYTVQTSDIGRRIRVAVSGVYPYTGYTRSEKSSIVSAGSVLKYVRLKNNTSDDRGIENPIVGDVLSAYFLPEMADVSYQWMRGETLIPGATSQYYELAEADTGCIITVTVTGNYPYSGSLSASSGMVTNPAAVPVILTDTLDEGTVGVPYYFKLKANVKWASWEVVSGYSLPGGLALDYLTGEITGTPIKSGGFTVRFKIINDNGSSYKDIPMQIRVCNANLISANWNSITDITVSGTDSIDEIEALLPSQIEIETTEGTSAANLKWDLSLYGDENSANATYTYPVTVSLDLPETITNTDNVATEKTVSITVIPDDSEELLSIDSTDIVDKVYSSDISSEEILDDLPGYVPITTTVGTDYAALVWNLDGFNATAGESYSFTATAEIVLPENVDNTVGDPLTRSITITVKAPEANVPQSNEDYTEDIQEPTYYDEPVYTEPVYDEPEYNDPVYDEPDYSEETTEALTVVLEYPLTETMPEGIPAGTLIELQPQVWGGKAPYNFSWQWVDYPDEIPEDWQLFYMPNHDLDIILTVTDAVGNIQTAELYLPAKQEEAYQSWDEYTPDSAETYGNDYEYGSNDYNNTDYDYSDNDYGNTDYHDDYGDSSYNDESTSYNDWEDEEYRY